MSEDLDKTAARKWSSSLVNKSLLDGKADLLRLMVAFIAASLGFCLTGCTLGQDFHRPEAPSTDKYTQSPLSPETVSSHVSGGEAQRFVYGEDIPAQWWTLFQSEALDRLVRQALTDSPTLAAAQAALRQAQENLTAQRGVVLYPTVDAKASAARQKFSGSSIGQPGGGFQLTLYNASVDVSYALDLFGGGRRELEALLSQVDYQRFQIEGVYLTLTSNVVTASVKDASLRAQISAMREIAAAQEKQLVIVEKQFHLGGASRSDVLAQQTQLAQTRAALPPLEKGLEQNRHFLSVLAGKPPGGADLPEFYFKSMRLPQELPVSLPSSLVRQRPDVRSSEEMLHAASAQIGVATANLYPQITLTGSYGSEATKLQNLFGGGSSVWSFGSGLLQPVFHGGELTAKRRAAIAAYDEAEAQYRETVLKAFQDVADVLRALDNDARTLKAQAEAASAARDALELTKKQFALGAVSYLSLLNAERQYQQARLGLIQAQADRFADTAALFQALGGGWWNRQENFTTESRIHGGTSND